MLGYYKKQIITLKQQLNNLDPEDNNLEPLIDIQLNILQKIIHTENSILYKKKELKNLRIELRQGRYLKKDSINKKKKIKFCEKRIKDYGLLIYFWKCFGDGIAFKYIDKWNLKRLMYEIDSPNIKQNAGFINGKQGIENELSVLFDIKDQGIPALLNDLTNTIRHGDICLMGSSDPYVIEIKSSKNSNKRVERQLSAIKRIHDYLATDEANIAGTEKMKRVTLKNNEIDFNKEINNSIIDALSGKTHRISPEKGLYYILIKSSGSTNYDELFKGIDEPIVFMLNQTKNEQAWGNYYPFTLSISSPESLYGFINGEIYILVVLDGKIIKQKASSAGYKIEYIMDGKNGVSFTTINLDKEPITTTASEHLFGRIGHEFLSIKWFIDFIQQNAIDMEEELLSSTNSTNL